MWPWPAPRQLCWRDLGGGAVTRCLLMTPFRVPTEMYLVPGLSEQPRRDFVSWFL